MINISSIDLAITMKKFLEIVQPLPVKYGYTRGIKQGDCYITYQQASTTMTRAIGNQLIGERQTFIVTVQTKTAEQNMLYSQLIRRGTERSSVEFVSDGIRKDTTVKDGYVNTIILYIYTSVEAPQMSYTPEQVQIELQEITDRYIFITSIYNNTLSESIIDKFIVPKLDKEQYSYAEFLALKQKYLDKLLLTTEIY